MSMKAICLAACLPLTWIGGCEMTRTPGLGEETGATRLPTGLRLLEADDAACLGTVQLLTGIRAADEALRIAAGENATFRIEQDEIAWACLDEQSAASETLECPVESTYVRITRGAAGQEILFECYG
jgi:hypothetical protein